MSNKGITPEAARQAMHSALVSVNARFDFMAAMLLIAQMQAGNADLPHVAGEIAQVALGCIEMQERIQALMAAYGPAAQPTMVTRLGDAIAEAATQQADREAEQPPRKPGKPKGSDTIH